ncbi:MAG TPA: NADH-quinone oxidoreductase subunit J [Candidatus Acidoferrales bacterium]|nr:NADH-quinone oxidoreductase subunit J [Candidatus Acidoferrales bacterium]
MTAEAILFFVFAGLAVIGALNLVLQRHPIHSALSLILVMVSLAVLYLLLGAEFIAAIQIIVYAGAIMVLFVFVIMLLNAGEEEHTNWSRMARYFGLPVAVVLLLELGWLLYRSWPGDTLVQSDRMVGRTAAVGQLLFRDYVLPFELTSILILVAILGAVVLAKKEL